MRNHLSFRHRKAFLFTFLQNADSEGLYFFHVHPCSPPFLPRPVKGGALCQHDLLLGHSGRYLLHGKLKSFHPQAAFAYREMTWIVHLQVSRFFLK
nr:MAG TPA: hypothetical protein [Caudoviricetes sp.]